MYNRGRKHNRQHYNGYHTQATFIQPQYLEKEPTPPSWLQSWTAGVAMTIAVLFFFNLVKLPSPLDVILPWLLILVGLLITALWLFNWNADRAADRRIRTGEPRNSSKGKIQERLDEDSHVQPLTPEELAGSTIPVNRYGKPIERIAPLTPVNMRGFVVQRSPEMDDLSTWDLLTQPGFARSTTKYIGTIGEGDING